MIHHEVLETIKKDKQQESFILPYYGKYSIAEIPPTVLQFFGIPSYRQQLPPSFLPQNLGTYNKILFFFVDGFGYNHFTDYHPSLPFFAKLAEVGEVYPVTSVFPSTTPAALTTLHTNLTPQEHGLPEWTVYFEEFDRIIETFPFRPILTSEREALLQMGGHPEMLFKGTTVYETLAASGIKPYVFIYEEYAGSAYSRMTQKGSTVVAFRNFADLFDRLSEIINNETNPAYFFVYWSHVDSMEHIFGPGSKEHIQALTELSSYLTDNLMKKLEPKAIEDTLFMLTSDHGQSSIKGEDIIYLNAYLDLENNYLRSPSTNTIYPTGAPHDVFLHIYPPKIAETVALLKQKLAGKADILPIREAIEENLFGLNTPTERFLKRVGDILILPYEGYHVWYKHSPTIHYGQRGMHGGLSEEEMIVPFAVAPLTKLLL